MKKIICLLSVLLLLVSFVPCVYAAPSASLNGPSTVRAGDTISVSFYAGGITGCTGSISYDSSLLTLNGYTASIGGSWAVEFNGNNFICYDNNVGEPIGGSTLFKASFTVKNSVAAGTKISVSANSVTLSNGDDDTYVGTCTYSATIAPPLSGNNKLSALTVSNATISPAFSADTTKYTASVPFSTSSLQVSATAADSKAKVSVGNTALTAGGTTNVTVTVTAENGNTREYVIRVTRAQDPNYVKSSNADLKSLSVEGFTLSPVFQADVTDYYVWLPYETESVSVKAEKADSKASLVTGASDALTPGKGTPVSITVTAEDGTEKIYTVTVVRAPAHADTQAFLNGEREEVTEPETEPPTEPETVPETVPVTEPVSEPETKPATEPVSGQDETPDKPAGNPTILIVTGIICLVIGITIGFFIFLLTGKKRNP